MTELQTGLIGLGAIAIIGVVVYNKWQEYRQRKLAEQVLNVRHADVLLDESASGENGAGYAPSGAEPVVEPETHSPEESAAPSIMAGSRGVSTALHERIEPVFRFDEVSPEAEKTSPDPSVLPRPFAPGDVEPAFESPSEPVPPAISETPAPPPPSARLRDDTKDVVEPLHLLSPVIDYVAAFEAVEPAPVYQIVEAQRDALARVRKPVHWIGYNEFSREWETIDDRGENEYRRVRVGLQVVDRQGSLRESDLSVFYVAMQKLAAELKAIVELPPRQPALDAAAKLDEFCASVDIQIGINVISQAQAFAGTKLRALAEAAGMVIDGDGRFVRCDDDGNVLYILLNQEASGFSAEAMKAMTTHGVTFLLDVPRVVHGERVFNQMVDLARRFADVLHGSLVDDNRRPLSESALEPIRRQVGEYQSVMAAQGLPAGGLLARRLFS